MPACQRSKEQSILGGVTNVQMEISMKYFLSRGMSSQSSLYKITIGAMQRME
jgi:hypothetical protein